MLINPRHSFLLLVPLFLSYCVADPDLTSPVAPKDYTAHSRRALDKLTDDRTFQLIDSNKDGRLSLYELQDAAKFMWDDHEASNRARLTFKIPHPADFIHSYDSDGMYAPRENANNDLYLCNRTGDGQLSKDEFTQSMSDIQVQSSSECTSLSERLDTCKTHEIIQCSGMMTYIRLVRLTPTLFIAYINTAEQMCRLGHTNVIEQCIFSSPCGSICGCIRQAEKAAQHDSVFVLQYPDGQQEYATGNSLVIANATNEVGHHEKRFFFLLFLGLIIAAVLNIAVSAALISISEIEQNTGKQVGFMDFDVRERLLDALLPSADTTLKGLG